MAKVQRLPSGRYRARVWDNDRQTYTSLGTFPTKREAEKAQALGVPAKTDSKPVVRLRGQMTLERFADALLLARRHRLSASTYEVYASKLRRWIYPTLGTVKLADVTTEMVDAWFASLPATPGRKLTTTTLSMVLRHAVRRGEIKESPFKVEGYSVKTRKRPPQHMADVHMMLGLTDDPTVRALLLTLVGAGLRISEGLGMDWECIDFGAGTITVRQHLTKAGGLEPGFKWHAGEERVVVCLPEALEALLTLRNTHSDIPTGAVFLNRLGERMSYATAWARLNNLRRAVGLEMTWHDFRRLHATIMSQVMSVEMLMSQLGHETADQSLHYVNSDIDARRAAVARIHN